jgi:hypothetical protein
MADPPAEAAEGKPQSSLDIGVNCPSEIGIAEAHGNLHFILQQFLRYPGFTFEKTT